MTARSAIRFTVFLGALSASGCSSLTAPALKHETGETLGAGRYSVAGRLESSRMFGLVDSSSSAYGVAQNSNVFQGSLLGMQGAYGLSPKLDLSVGAFFSLGGGGWRIAAKYQILGKSKLAVAALLGYGAYSGSGDIHYLTTSFSADIPQTLAGKIWEISFPVSYRLSQSFMPYAGLNYYRGSVSGSSGTGAVSDSSGDFGPNLGIRYFWSQVYSDVEFSYVSIHDPFSGGSRFVPFFGLGVGVTF